MDEGNSNKMLIIIIIIMFNGISFPLTWKLPPPAAVAEPVTWMGRGIVGEKYKNSLDPSITAECHFCTMD